MRTLRTLYVMTLLLLLGTGCSKQGGESDKHYQQGQVYEAQQRIADAQRAYLLAIEADDSKPAVMQACTAMGHLYLNQQDATSAQPWFERSLVLARQCADTTQMVFSLRNLARCQKAKPDHGQALQLYQQADSLINSSHTDSLRTYLYPEYISTLIALHRMDEAQQLTSLLAQQSLQGTARLMAGKLFRELGYTDSATYNFLKCQEADQVCTRMSATMYLAEISHERGNAEQAYTYAMECMALIDQLRPESRQENANLISSLSSQLEVERENSRLYFQRAIILTTSALIVAILIIYGNRRIEQLRRQAERYRQSQILIRRNQLSRQEQLVNDFHATPLYKQIAQTERMTETDWQQLTTFLDQHVDEFTTRLQAFYPKLKPQELQVCCLLKLEFGNLQIANILCRTQQAITNLRKRLYHKMFNKDGTADDLTQFIRLFPDN